ncbi:peptidase domain-containing ABC transporter [Cupriavidus basilensis]|uniref:peptidase domain-containing ABC transporter n=1 Tax=Cupriavidus basilensis TaxID=68895 RepID=UPI0023E80631|nr:peptidase domain-containing ABC transporter [Cupriavidus basilensis]MDF3882111.1 peptidase domain-containing ABC transporter [Cupriavidus basilensis]
MQLLSPWRRRVPALLQSEAAECGLACLAMVASYHGYKIDLPTLRRRFPVSLKGLTLEQLSQLATRLGLAARAVKAELDALGSLELPCILHWNFHHFVVLTDIRQDSAVIHDPALGRRVVRTQELSRSFTGVALQVWPDQRFKQHEARARIRLRDLIGRVIGFKKTAGQIVLVALCIELFTITMPFYMQTVLDKGVVSADLSLVTALAICFGIFCVMQQGLIAVRAWMLAHLGASLTLQWKNSVFAHLLKLPVEYFQKRHLGDVVSRASAVDVIQRTLTTRFIATIVDGAMAIAILCMISVYGPVLLIAPCSALLGYAVARLFMEKSSRLAQSELVLNSAKQNSYFLETIRGIRAIKLFNRIENRRSTWLTLLAEQINSSLRSERYIVIAAFMSGTILGVERIFSVWLAATKVLDGTLTAGAMVAFLAYREQLASRAAAMVDNLFEARLLRLQGERLADIVLSTPEEDDATITLGAQSCDMTQGATLALHGVSYRYSRFDRFIFQNLCVEISAGSSLAIIGPSGSGKSTLLGLLMGSLRPTTGQIRLAGLDMSTLDKESLRDMIGVVMQDDVLFAGTIAENISFFAEKPERVEIERCAKLAAVHQEIIDLPMGYDTLVGDMGSALSGGQKQRILIARCLFKKPRVMLLDEATSHLDVDCESRVNMAIQSLRITRIIVAHRPETIAAADSIWELSNGTLLPVGRERFAALSLPEGRREAENDTATTSHGG